MHTKIQKKRECCIRSLLINRTKTHYFVIHDNQISNTEREKKQKQNLLDSVSGNCRIETPQYLSMCNGNIQTLFKRSIHTTTPASMIKVKITLIYVGKKIV